MPITIHQQPQAYSTASNPLVFTFSSLFVSAQNFSFVVKLFINNNVHSTHQVFVESGDRAKFNASELVRTVLSSPLILNTAFAQDYSSAYCTYKIQVFEKFGNPPTLNEEDPVFSDERIAFNGALRHDDWLNFNYLEFMPWNSNPESQFFPYKFLTKFPREKKEYVAMDQQKFLGILSQTFEIDFQINLFDISGNPIPGSYYQEYLPGSQAVTVFNIGPGNIMDNTPITQAMFDSAAYYTIRMNDAGQQGFTQGQSEAYKLYIDRDCRRYNWIRLHWLNKYGVWDAFTFKMISFEETDVKQDTYESTRGIWNESNEWEYTLQQGERKSFGTRAKDTITINTDWICEEEQNWLMRSLIESPKVFIERETGFERCVVKTKRYKLKTRKVDRMIQETIDIERTYSFNSQID